MSELSNQGGSYLNSLSSETHHDVLIMKDSPVFLLSRSIEVTPRCSEVIYDHERHINVLLEDGVTPAVLSQYGTTQSKTDSAVGDDDPDPSSDKCY